MGFQVCLPQSDVSIVAARQQVQLVVDGSVDAGSAVNGCRVYALPSQVPLALVLVNVLAVAIGNLPDPSNVV